MDMLLIIMKLFFTFLYILVWVLVAKKYHKTIWDSFKGTDKILQISEFVVIIGLIAYILMIPADAFWGITASSELWIGINLIISVSLGVSTYLKSKENQ